MRPGVCDGVSFVCMCADSVKNACVYQFSACV